MNAEEEPELPDYPKDPEFKKKFGPRGVLHTFADGRIEDTGALTKKRMETIDDEVNAKACAFIDRAHKEDKPFFVWWNSTHMHFRTHVKNGYEGKSGQGFYNDAMVYHDETVGTMLKKLDDLGIADDTIVLYSTDNGPHFNSWPDAGITPFRSEKNTNWEGAFRVPAFARWPNKFKAGSIVNGIVSHQDWLPTLLTAAGEPDIGKKLLGGYKAGSKTFKVAVDGHDMSEYFTGKVAKCPRDSFFYVNDDGQLVALRYGDWKFVFLEQRAKTLACWAEPFVQLRVPKLFNLRRDPFERADENSNTYYDWMLDHTFLFVPAQAYVAQQIQSLREFPPRQKPASFNLDAVLATLQDSIGGGRH